MHVSTRYTLVGDTAVEIVTVQDGDNITMEVNVLPPEIPLEVTTAAPSTTPELPPEVVAQPLGETPLCLTASPPTRKERGLMGLIRGMYTVLFSLLGMAGAAFAYLKDNLSQLTDIKWQTIAIIVGGALLAGLGYGLKKYYKPEGIL